MTSLFRAVIMLTVLVAAPALWIYHGPLPRPAQQVVEGVVADVRAWFVSASPTDAQTGLLSPAARFPAPGSGILAADATRSTDAPFRPIGAAEALAARMEPLLAQLRQQGASEYALESWGAGGRHFRFTCMLPLHKNADHVRQFEAIAEDPEVAVEQVLAEASGWQLARHGAILSR